MAEETFDIVYKTDVSAAQPGIEYLKGATIALGEFAFQSGEQVSAMGKSASTSAKGLGVLSKAIDELAAKRKQMVDLSLSFEFLDSALVSIRQGLAGVSADLRSVTSQARDVGRVTYAMEGLNKAAFQAEGNIAGVSAGIGAIGTSSSKLGTAKVEMTAFQRSAYGARMNVTETTNAVDSLIIKSAGLKGAGSGFTGFGKQVQGFGSTVEATTPKVGGLGSSMLALQARIAVFQALKGAVEALGKSITDARETTDKWASGNLSLRDEYRELANLQEKAEPDNEVVGGALRFRIATGMDDHGANDVLRRFEGELPAAKQAGNITGNATSGVAGDYLKEAARSGLRAGLSGSTTGLLAAKIAMSDKIGTADEGVGKFQTIIDLLNRGSGDLTPLVQSLVNTAGGNVGKDKAFKNLPQLAAAIEVASENATPAMAGTRVRQALTGINRLRLGATGEGPPMTEDQADKMTEAERNKWIIEHHGEAKLKSLKAASARDAKKGILEKDDATHVFMRDQARKGMAKAKGADLGLKQDDFAGNIEKLAKHLEGKKDVEAELIAMGLKNQTERRAIMQFIQNRKRLRTETDAANKGVDPKEAKRLNEEFMKGDTAQMRVAKAKNDASEFVRGTENEKLQVARKAAEERLRSQGKIDTPASNFDEAMADNAGARLGAQGVRKAAGLPIDPRTNPIGMGGVPTRQLKIDAEAMAGLKTEAKRVGIDADKFQKNMADDSTFEERFNALAKAVQAKGGNPFGGGPGNNAAGANRTDMLLQSLIREVQRGNEIARANAQNAQKPPFLPQQPAALRGVQEALGRGLGVMGLGLGVF